MENKINIIEKYTVYGVPLSSLKRMCKELEINEDLLHEYLNGQTMGLIGGESLIYVDDIVRFIKRLPVID